MNELDFDQMINDLHKKRETLFNLTDDSPNSAFSTMFDEDYKNCLDRLSQTVNKKFINYNLNDLEILDLAKTPEIRTSNNFEINRIRGKNDIDNLRLTPIQRQDEVSSCYPRSVITEDSGYRCLKMNGCPRFISRDQFMQLYKKIRKE